MPRKRPRIDLGLLERGLGDNPALGTFLQLQADIFKVGTGVLRNGNHLPGLWPLSFQPFCNLVRRSPAGQSACAECDKRHCHLCRQQPNRQSLGDFQRFRCHMGLIDLPAPIRVRGALFAHLFMGQILAKKPSKRFLKGRYNRLGLGASGVTFDELWTAYNDLPVRTLAEIRSIDQALLRCAAVLSSSADSIYTLHTLSKLSADLIPFLDISTGLRAIYHTVSELLHADSGSVWLAHRRDGKGPALGFPTVLRPEVLCWFDEVENASLCETLHLAVGDGIAGWIAEKRRLRECSSKREIEQIPAANAELRERRDLRSLIGVPIMSYGSLLGVIELGWKKEKEKAFLKADLPVIELAARMAASLVRRTKERNLVIDMHCKTTDQEVFGLLERELPRLFGALSANVFLPRNAGDKTRLSAVTSQAIIRGEGPGAAAGNWLPDYDIEAGEGLTGWVAKYKRPLRVDRCNRPEEVARAYERVTTEQERRNQDPPLPGWTGKTRAVGERESKRLFGPVLVAPVLANDSHQDLLAVLRIAEREGEPFGAEDEAYLQSICGQLSICLHNFAKRDQMKRQEMSDVVIQCTHDFFRLAGNAERLADEAVHAHARHDGFQLDRHLKDMLLQVGKLRRKLDEIVEIRRTGNVSPIGAAEPACLGRLVEEAVRQLEESARESPVPVAVDPRIGAPLARLEVDAAEFRKHVDNILSNSVEAGTRRGLEKIVLRVEFDVIAKGTCGLRFVDNCGGFEPGLLEAVNRGQALPRDQRHGAGIALQECRLFVMDRLGGGFGASNVGDGACVQWVFPCKQEESQHESIAAGSRGKGGRHRQHRRTGPKRPAGA